MERNRPLTQQYENYTAEDFKVWHTLFDRQLKLLKQHASYAYLDAIDKIGFIEEEIPDFKKVNDTLQCLTGWQLTVVPGLVPQRDFFELLSRRIFPATCWLRTFAELDYIEEPDMFHDVFGHVPLLTNVEYAGFMQAFGTMALEWIDDPEIIGLLSKIYWFTIEFGLIDESDDTKAYGAGILSSPGETLHCMKPEVAKNRFQAANILNTSYRTDALQEQYFVIDDFAQLDSMLPLVKQLIISGKYLTSKQEHKKIS